MFLALAGLGGCDGSQDTQYPGQWPPPIAAEVGSVPWQEPPASSLRGSKHTYEIEVVEKSTGLPAQEAEVLYLPGAIDWKALGYSERLHFLRLPPGGEAVLMRYGKIAKTDAAGIVRLDLTADRQDFVVRKKDLRGEIHTFSVALPSATGSSRHRVEIEHSTEILVEVVDSTGRPKPGVEVCATFGSTGNSATYYADNPQATVRVRKPHWAASNSDWKSVRITPVILGHRSEGVTVDFSDPNPRPVTLRCPPTGRVLIDKSEISTSNRDNLLFVVAGRAEAGRHAWYAKGEVAVAFPREDNGYLIPFVALTQRVMPMPIGINTFGTASGGDYDVQGGILPEVFSGPASANEEVRITLRDDPDDPVVSGRATDIAGNPIQSALSVEFSMDDAGEKCRRVFRVVTDASGKFSVVLPKYVVDLRLLGVLYRSLDSYGFPTGLVARSTCPMLSKGSRADIGVIALRRPPHLVRLFLRDSSGRIVRREHWVQVRMKGTDTWSTIYPEYMELRSDGSIDYYTEARDGQWRVVFTDPGVSGHEVGSGIDVPVEFIAGSSRLEVQLGSNRR